MRQALTGTRKAIYLFSKAIIVLFFLTITLGQVLPVEFTNPNLKETYYSFILFGVPIAILLTLTGINRKTDRTLVVARSILTPLIAIISFFVIINLMLRFDLGMTSWDEREILFHQKARPEVVVVKETGTVGVFGAKTTRIVKKTSFTPVFQMVQEVDTLLIDSKYWVKMPQNKAK